MAVSRSLEENLTYFFSNIQEENGCWIWQAAIHRATGYASFMERLAHRWAFDTFRGELVEGLVIDHICSVRNCVNPDHLQQITQRDNTLRSKKGVTYLNSIKTHCKHGHELAGDNVRKYSGKRICRKCTAKFSTDFKIRNRDRINELQRKRRQAMKLQLSAERYIGKEDGPTDK